MEIQRPSASKLTSIELIRERRIGKSDSLLKLTTGIAELEEIVDGSTSDPRGESDDSEVVENHVGEGVRSDVEY